MSGRDDALAGAGRLDDAVRVYKEALSADPSLSDVGRRVDVLAFRAQQATLSTARQAFEAGRLDEAAAAYQRAIDASPDSGLLYRELAGVERKKGDADRALEHLRKAAALDTSDARALVQIGELLEERGDFSGAVDAYAKAAGARARRGGAHESSPGHESASTSPSLPEEYKAIGSAPQVTRGDLGRPRRHPPRGALLQCRSTGRTPWC